MHRCFGLVAASQCALSLELNMQQFDTSRSTLELWSDKRQEDPESHQALNGCCAQLG